MWQLTHLAVAATLLGDVSHATDFPLMLQQRSKRRIAAVIRKFPFVMTIAHTLWRQTRPRFSVGAVGVVFNSEGHLLLVEHVFHPYHPWGLPGGWVDRGEAPKDAVRRELREELELEVEVVAVVSTELSFKRHLDVAYLCYPLNNVGQLCNELSGYQWTALNQLPVMHHFHLLAIQQAVEVRGQQA